MGEDNQVVGVGRRQSGVEDCRQAARVLDGDVGLDPGPLVQPAQGPGQQGMGLKARGVVDGGGDDAKHADSALEARWRSRQRHYNRRADQLAPISHHRDTEITEKTKNKGLALSCSWSRLSSTEG